MILSIVTILSEGVKEGFYIFLLFLLCFYETLFSVKLEKFPSLLHTYYLSITYVIVFLHFISFFFTDEFQMKIQLSAWRNRIVSDI